MSLELIRTVILQILILKHPNVSYKCHQIVNKSKKFYYTVQKCTPNQEGKSYTWQILKWKITVCMFEKMSTSEWVEHIETTLTIATCNVNIFHKIKDKSVWVGLTTSKCTRIIIPYNITSLNLWETIVLPRPNVISSESIRRSGFSIQEARRQLALAGRLRRSGYCRTDLETVTGRQTSQAPRRWLRREQSASPGLAWRDSANPTNLSLVNLKLQSRISSAVI